MTAIRMTRPARRLREPWTMMRENGSRPVRFGVTSASGGSTEPRFGRRGGMNGAGCGRLYLGLADDGVTRGQQGATVGRLQLGEIAIAMPGPPRMEPHLERKVFKSAFRENQDQTFLSRGTGKFVSMGHQRNLRFL